MKKKLEPIKIFSILLPVIVYFLVYNLSDIFITLLVNHLGFSGFDNIYIKLFCSLFGIISLLVLAKNDRLNFTVYNLGRFDVIRSCPSLLFPVIVAVIGMGLNILFTYIGINRLSPAGSETIRSQFMVPIFPGLVLYGILVPIAEELIYRGLIYNRLKKSLPLGICLIISSLMFGAYHGNLIQGIYGFLMGLLLALSYEATGKFIIPILGHGLTNALVFLITYDGSFLNRFVR